MAVWEHWTAVRGVLRQLPQARLADPAAVRAEIRAARILTMSAVPLGFCPSASCQRAVIRLDASEC